MGLGLAGAISGAGNAMTQGLQTLNSGIVQMGINQSLAKNDREFQMKKLELQQQFEREMQTEKMAADKANTLAIVEAQGGQARKTQAERLLGEKDIRAQDQAAADARLDKQLEATRENLIAELAVKKDLHEQDIKVGVDKFNATYNQQERQFMATKNKVSTVSTSDGRVLLMSPQGKGLGYLKDDKGKEIKIPTDLPKSALVEINALVDEMHDMSREYAKQSMHTTDQENAYKAAKKRIRGEIAEVLSAYTDERKPRPSSETAVVMPKFPVTGPQSRSQTPEQDVTSPMPSVPSNITKSSGMLGAAKGLVPGLGMIENFLRK